MGLLRRLIRIADDPSDDDDRRLRKRMGVAGGIATVFAPLGAPFLSGGHPAAVVLGPAFSLFSVANLLVLARTHRFERYVAALLAAGAAFTLLMDVVAGGLGSGAGIVWSFLAPAYGILALGPRKALPWFVVFLGVLLVAVIIDPWASSSFAQPPYAVKLISFAQNIGIPLSLTYLLLHYTDVRRRAAEARSEALLTNAIPQSIADRLKHGEERIAEAYPETTVLFADIVGFTPWAGETDPDRVVSLLDDLFRRFDAVVADGGLEKIKTIGDAYMAVAGAPTAHGDHAQRALDTGGRMLDAFAEWTNASGVGLSLRVGMASGPVVGGVIGERRILFDLWGATVNTASRMQSHGVPGRIQVAASTWETLGRPATFEPRAIDVKGMGEVTAYVAARGGLMRGGL